MIYLPYVHKPMNLHSYVHKQLILLHGQQTLGNLLRPQKFLLYKPSVCSHCVANCPCPALVRNSITGATLGWSDPRLATLARHSAAWPPSNTCAAL